MTIFKKTCFECGTKTDILFEGKCEICFSKDNPPIKEVKPINLRICNMCSKIHYKNGLFNLDQIYEMLPMIVEKNLVLNEHYKLNSIEIENFKIDGNKLIFDVVTDSSLIL